MYAIQRYYLLLQIYVNMARNSTGKCCQKASMYSDLIDADFNLKINSHRLRTNDAGGGGNLWAVVIVKSTVNMLTWLLIGFSLFCSQSGASSFVDQTLDNDYNSKISIPGYLSAFPMMAHIWGRGRGRRDTGWTRRPQGPSPSTPARARPGQPTHGEGQDICRGIRVNVVPILNDRLDPPLWLTCFWRTFNVSTHTLPRKSNGSANIQFVIVDRNMYININWFGL